MRNNVTSITTRQDREQLRAQLAEVFEVNHRLFVAIAAQNLFKRIKREAEDVVQDAFLAAVEQLDQFRGESTMKTWVNVIIQRTAWRRNKNQEPTLGFYQQLEGQTIPAPESFCEQLEANDTLNKLIGELTEDQQEFIQRWRADEFKGHMEQSSNRNNLSRTKVKMRSIAEKNGLTKVAA